MAREEHGSSLLLLPARLEEISSNGQSGCEVELELLADGRSAVRKRASTEEKRSRLGKQIQKQIAFAATSQRAEISSPEVFEWDELHGGLMALVNGTSLGCFLATAPHKKSCQVTEILLTLMSDLMKMCVSQRCDPALQGKLHSLNEGGHLEIPLFASRQLLTTLGSIFEENPTLPVGVGHGDFSFENILVERATGRIMLIDFLDMPVESPVLDLARLYLDAHFSWWAFFGHDPGRLRRAEEYLRDGILRTVAEYAISRRLFDALVVLTILRILPYTSNPIRKGLLRGALHKIAQSL